MKIIIVGDGKVGFTLAEHLSQEEHDVTVIDTNDDALRRASESLDVMCVKGNGASISALRESGADTADVVIAATSMDEVNMVCCLTAKRLGAKYVIARVRNVEYAAELATLKQELGIDMVINPENATAVEISRLLRFPSAANIETFYRGRVELIGFRVQEGDFIVGHPLSAQSHKLQELPMLMCAVERCGEVTIPDGSFVPQAEDRLYLIGQPSGLTDFFKLLGRYTPRLKDVFLVGGGRIAHYLTAILEHLGMRVKIVERSMDRCRHLSEVLPRTMVICGDGTDQELLEQENISAADAFVALTDRDEIYLVRQYRYALGQELWELPAGKLEKGEDPFEAAKRELAEECGLVAEHYTDLGEFYPTVGYCSEIIYTWMATGLTPCAMHLDEDEFLTPENLPFAEAVAMVLDGRIKDGKTVAAILKIDALRRRKAAEQ